MIRARVITCSDGVSSGHREDRSGPVVREILEKSGYGVEPVVVGLATSTVQSAPPMGGAGGPQRGGGGGRR